MVQSFLIRQQEQGRRQVDVKFPQQEASHANQRPLTLSLEDTLFGAPESLQVDLRCGEVGSVAWAQAVKCAIQPGSESTTGSSGWDNMDARTSEASSCELETPHSQGPQRSASPSAELFPHSVPVMHTFVHFDFDADLKAGISKLRRSSSAPEVMCKTPFQRIRNPEMEQLHFKGECRPCAYFFHKADGCRRGTECTFCHLCPREAVKAQRKEKMKLAKRELYEQAKLSKQFQPCVYWWQRKQVAKLCRSITD
mmetsp:Transcript_75808/g.142877  ORF Transcript_75808/g.142877 Transcript_75808/m.142877 type:complete len:253 (-) Transcript_75808:271-1029(-)